MELSLLNYYRLKLSYQAPNEQGAITSFKDEHLVLACSYTEAEALAHKIVETNGDMSDTDIEIVRTKINTVVFNKAFEYSNELIKPTPESQGFVEYYMAGVEDEEGLYSVTVLYTHVDEVSGKEKKSSENIYVPAESPNQAIMGVKKYLDYVGETRFYNIRNVKFDKALSVLVHIEQHKNNMAMYDAL